MYICKSPWYVRGVDLFCRDKKKEFENTGGKGENADNQQFFLFPQCFELYQRNVYVVICILCRLQMFSI